jgi:ABC-type uncharacterized transport system auxiliary subunit
MNPRRRVLRLGAAWSAVGTGALAGGLAGCGSLTNTAPAFEFFVIEDLSAATEPPASAPRIDRTILLTLGQTQALYDSDRMVFTRDGASRAYYQYANWGERPSRRLLSLTEQRLARRARFRTVARTTSGVRGDLLLSLRLEELVHDESTRPPVLRESVSVELVDWRTRELLGRQTFAQTATVATPDARGAARAANIATTALLDALTDWVETTAAKAAPR